jgi:hypothetical protein
MTVDLANVRLLIASPAYNGVSNNYFHATHKLRSALNKDGVFSKFITVPGVPVDAARDTIGNGFLALSRTSDGFSHCLMVDSDIGWEVDTVYKMIRRNVDFAAAAAPLRRVNWGAVDRAAKQGKTAPEKHAAIFTANLIEEGGVKKMKLDEHGFMPIEETGGAFLLLKPAVFAAIHAANPQLVYKRIDGMEECQFFRPDIIDGRRCGEDIAFQKRWRKTGGQIHLLVDAPLTHEGPFTFSGNYRDMTSLGQ